jgi:transposase
MDEIGILPEFKGSLVRDGWASYKWYEQCLHSLCNAHLLRELVYINEVDPTQEAWIEPFMKLLFSAKKAASDSKAAGKTQMESGQQNAFLNQYEKITRKARKLNPDPPKQFIGPGPPTVKKRETGPTPRSIINRLQKKRDDVLRFMTDLNVPFDNNGSERDLRMLKLIQKISGCFRTGDGARRFCRIRSYVSTARKQGHSLLCAVERVAKGRPVSVGC